MNPIKQKYIERAEYHQLHDNIIQGTYWKDGKGCCDGCGCVGCYL